MNFKEWKAIGRELLDKKRRLSEENRAIDESYEILRKEMDDLTHKFGLYYSLSEQCWKCRGVLITDEDMIEFRNTLIQLYPLK